MRLPDLVIALGDQLSNEVELVSVDKARIYGPAAFTGTVTVEISPDGAAWYDSGVVATVDDFVDLNPALASHVRLSSDMVEAAERVCPVIATGQQHV